MLISRKSLLISELKATNLTELQLQSQIFGTLDNSIKTS